MKSLLRCLHFATNSLSSAVPLKPQASLLTVPLICSTALPYFERNLFANDSLYARLNERMYVRVSRQLACMRLHDIVLPRFSRTLLLAVR